MSDEQKSPLTFAEVQEILRLLEQSTFDELQLDIGNLRLRLRRGAATMSSSAPSWEDSKSQEGAQTPQITEAKSRSAGVASAAPGLIDVRSPMLGIFYRAPRPGAPAFVDVGAKVDVNTTIGIIEVMKLMNAVPAGIEGEIGEICVENGQLVEYDQVLMRVVPH